MAARPLSAAAAQNPFMDLLFSARPAFVWDGAKAMVSWMNAAARERFALGPAEFSSALPAGTAASLASFVNAKTKKDAFPAGAVALKLPGKRRVYYSLQRLELAGGTPGAMAVEYGVRAPQLPEPPASQPKIRKPRKKLLAPAKNAAPCTALTPGELRSFRAIGKTVLKLCDAKHAAAKNTGGAAPQGREPQSAFAALLAAFDLVLTLDIAWAIEQCEGRPQRFGWRKPALIGAKAGMLFPASEQDVFRRMTAALRLEPGEICRETLLVRDESGAACPCVAFLGRHTDGRPGYFLAFLSLKLPQRLKKLQPQILRTAPPPRLAA